MKKLNQKGVSLIEGLLIVIAISLISFVGFYVYNANKQEPEVSNSSIEKQETPDSQSQKETLPELVEYGAEGIAIEKPADVSKLTQTSQSFKDFIANYVEESTKEPNEFCDMPFTVTISKVYKDEFASGGVNECGGAAMIWKKENGSWQRAWAGNDMISCEDIAKYKIPKQIQEDCQ